MAGAILMTYGVERNTTAKARIKMRSPSHITVMFRSTKYVINVHAGEYFICGIVILIFFVNIYGFETLPNLVSEYFYLEHDQNSKRQMFSDGKP